MPSDTSLFDSHGRLQPTAELLQLMVTGYALSATVFAAAELDVFAALDRPQSVNELAQRLGTHEDGLQRLLGALSAMGLVRRDESGDFECSPISAAFASNHPDSLRDVLLQHKRLFYDLMSSLDTAVRTGRTQLDRWTFAASASPESSEASAQSDCYRALDRAPEVAALFWRVMNRDSVGIGRFIAEHAPVRQARRLADLGGGGGQVAAELARALPDTAIVLVDRAPALRCAREHLAEQDLLERVELVEADLTSNHLARAVGSVDAIVMGGVLSDFDDRQREDVFARACSLLTPGGLMMVSESLLDDDRGGPLVPALLNLLMLTATGGRNFAKSDVFDLFARDGFTEPTVVRGRTEGLRDLVFAHRR